MFRIHAIQGLVIGLSLVPVAAYAEADSCRTPRFSDVGWTDITLTTSLTTGILEAIGYEPTIDVLGTEVTYQSMENKDIDIFLGTWVPALLRAAQPYYDKGSIETVRTNLTGAKFTLAVPHYVYEAGVHDFADLAKFDEKFGKKIYGVEPGGNKPIEDLVTKDAFGLGDWKLVESSEQGMLAEVGRAERNDGWIVFLGWAPHPMNRTYKMDYLTGGDDFYGPDYGASTVTTDVRAGYVKECPNVARLLENLEFSVDAENTMMEYVLGDGMQPREAANKWLAANPQWLENTLEGVTTFSGDAALDVARKNLGL